MKATFLTSARVAAGIVMATLLMSCGGGGMGDSGKKNLRSEGENTSADCESHQDHYVSSFLQIAGQPGCNEEELPEVVVNPKQDDDGDAFTQTMTKALDIFHPLIEEYYGAELELYNRIDDESVNAVARKSGKTWQIEMYGGMQRVKGMSHDAVTIVLCHEIGHLIGGFPLISNSGDQSMSAEGNSDYFATQACLKRMWQDEDDKNAEAAAVASALPTKLRNACRKNHEGQTDYQICMRTMAAIESIQVLFNKTSLTSPSPKAVARTLLEHPESQCRIDTLIAGALCQKDWDFERKFPKNPYDLRQVSCTRTEFGTTIYDGVRPRCWYQPKRVRPNSDTDKPKTKKKDKKKAKKKKKSDKRKPKTDKSKPKTDKSKDKKPQTKKKTRKKKKSDKRTPKTDKRKPKAEKAKNKKPQTKKPSRKKRGDKAHKRTSRNKKRPSTPTAPKPPHKRTKR